MQLSSLVIDFHFSMMLLFFLASDEKAAMMRFQCVVSLIQKIRICMQKERTINLIRILITI